MWSEESNEQVTRAHRGILVLVELNLYGLKGLHVQHVVSKVEWRLLVVEGREAHPLEVSPVALFSPHHHPHRGPLGDVYGLDHPWDLVDKSDGAGDVVQALRENESANGGDGAADLIQARGWGGMGGEEMEEVAPVM